MLLHQKIIYKILQKILNILLVSFFFFFFSFGLCKNRKECNRETPYVANTGKDNYTTIKICERILCSLHYYFLRLACWTCWGTFLLILRHIYWILYYYFFNKIFPNLMANLICFFGYSIGEGVGVWWQNREECRLH